MLFIVHNPLLEVKIHEGKMFVLITNVCLKMVRYMFNVLIFIEWILLYYYFFLSSSTLPRKEKQGSDGIRDTFKHNKALSTLLIKPWLNIKPTCCHLIGGDPEIMGSLCL